MMKKGLIVGALLGATAAGVTALLTTPKNGVEVRTALNKKYQNAKVTALQTAQTTKQKAQVEIAKFKAKRLVSEIEKSEITDNNDSQTDNIILNANYQAEEVIAAATESILTKAEANVTETNTYDITSEQEQEQEQVPNQEQEQVQNQEKVSGKFQSVEIVKDENSANLWEKTVNRYRKNKVKN